MNNFNILVGALLFVATGATSVSAASIRVIDGDTIDLGHVRYRLHGIDAPEVGQRCKRGDGSEWACGQVALQRMEELVQGNEVRCDARDTDMYGRVIAVCTAAGKQINAEMITSGMAWAFRKYSLDYVDLEDQAKLRHIGIWQAPNVAAWDYRTHKWEAATAEAPQEGCPIKGNINRQHEKIYHAPWSKDYEKTRIDGSKGERWFCSEAEAIAAGWRAPAFGR
ncbi:thermonuclease family protein [Rhizobium leguminosarum]|uniref:thermonuclease family protein n=1 Tax=Rhizobium leguminosarum TaxID=384 RepID=UPI0021BBBB62|nr:thermonuclease family protein [Rhizobium leguminosarum]